MILILFINHYIHRNILGIKIKLKMTQMQQKQEPQDKNIEEHQPKLHSLSPFTWTHLKLPPIINKIMIKNKIKDQMKNEPIIKYQPNKNRIQSPDNSKTKRKPKNNITYLNKTIDLNKDLAEHKKDRKSRQQSAHNRYRASMSSQQEMKHERFIRQNKNNRISLNLKDDGIIKEIKQKKQSKSSKEKKDDSNSIEKKREKAAKEKKNDHIISKEKKLDSLSLIKEKKDDRTNIQRKNDYLNKEKKDNRTRIQKKIDEITKEKKHNQEALQNKHDRVAIYKKHIILKHIQKLNNDQPVLNNKPENNLKQFVSRERSLQKIERRRSPIFSRKHSPSHNQPVSDTYSYNKIEGYLLRGFINSNWKQASSSQIPKLVWTDKFFETQLTDGQIHNHIKNSHQLTLKNYLHQSQSMFGSTYYPVSFAIPFQYTNFCVEYEQNIIKNTLKLIIQRARIQNLIPENYKIDKSLGTVLPKVISQRNNSPDTLLAIKLCLYLQNYRKKKNYRYFQISEHYIKMDTNLQTSMVESLVKACFQFIQGVKQSDDKFSSIFDVGLIDDEVLELLWHYYCLLVKFQKFEEKNNCHNLWIVKPAASSRGAGIFLLKNSLEYAEIFSHKFQYSHTKKFNNKIIQKYIENPYIIRNTLKAGSYADRKFDIRHWVLITCNKDNQPLIYVYQQGYCRFSDLKYRLTNYNQKDQQRIHLTNYSLYKNNSNNKSPTKNDDKTVLMLSQLFQLQKQQLNNRQYYSQQLETIIIETIMNNRQLKFQKDRFELFGYDVLLDANQKLWLLQVNLNPACQANRYPLLQKQAQIMTKNMLNIITKHYNNQQQQNNNKWKKIYGTESQKIDNSKVSIFTENLNQDNNNNEIQESSNQNESQYLNSSNIKTTSIKPFYSVDIDIRGSLVYQVRRRNILKNAIIKIVDIVNLREIWGQMKQLGNKNIQEESEDNQNFEDRDYQIKKNQVLQNIDKDLNVNNLQTKRQQIEQK